MISSFLKKGLRKTEEKRSIENVGPRNQGEQPPGTSPSPHKGVDSGGFEDSIDLKDIVKFKDSGNQRLDESALIVKDNDTFIFKKGMEHLTKEEVGFHRRLLHLRKMNEMSATATCGYLGLKNSALSNYENGVSRPGPSVAVKLALFYRVTLDYLYLGRVNGLSPNTKKRVLLYARDHEDLRDVICRKKLGRQAKTILESKNTSAASN